MRTQIAKTLSLACGLVSVTTFAATDVKIVPVPQFSEARANFERVRRMILREHMGEISEQKLYLAATKGMIHALNESEGHRWNELLSPNQIREFTVSLRGKVTGIGVKINFIPSTGTAHVQQVLKGSPADKSGIVSGDQILSVNGVFYKGKTQAHLSRDIRGEAGKSVELQVLRGAEILNKVVVRENVTWEPVESRIAQNDIGILRVRSFTQGSPNKVRDHLQKMKEVKGLIVDLRSNVGGVVDQAIEATDHLLPKGRTVAMLRGRRGRVKIFKSNYERVVDVPMIVLIDRKTSAGAELMAASLKENLGARLVGEKTFGKWNSQVIRKLPNNYAVKYTVHEFLTPKKNYYQNVGLPPDVNVAANAPTLVRLGAKAQQATRPQDLQLHTALQMMQLMQ